MPFSAQKVEAGLSCAGNELLPSSVARDSDRPGRKGSWSLRRRALKYVEAYDSSADYGFTAEIWHRHVLILDSWPCSWLLGILVWIPTYTEHQRRRCPLEKIGNYDGGKLTSPRIW
jgi:hypothetical protein